MTTIENAMEEHPYQPFIPENAKKLIIGSMPPQRFCKRGVSQEQSSLQPLDVAFYYGSQDNSFWDILGDVFGIEFEKTNTESAVDQRKEFLSKNLIGITDVVNRCVREGGAAEDKKLGQIEHKDLGSLLAEHPQIKMLIYTSNFIKQQVNKLFDIYHLSVDLKNRQFKVKINGKEYSVVVLYSPSPNGLRNMGKNGRERRKEQYREIFLSH